MLTPCLRPKKRALALGAAAFVFASAFACGPDFPLELLQNRAQTLQGLPSGYFDFEAAHLVPKPAEKLTPELDLDSAWFEASAENPVADRQKEIETKGYSPAQIEAWARARAADSAAQALTEASNLPVPDQHYLAGAVAFRAGDLAVAKSEFEAILALGAAGQSRVVWAEFMLARTALASGEGAGDADATAHFAAARALAAGGAPDPLGLAVASFGAQAQLSWWQFSNGDTNPADQATRQTSDIATELPRAVELYARQAAYGSAAANASLLVVARWLNKNSDALAQGLTDPLTRKLMTAYAFSRGFEAMDDAQTEAFTTSGDADYKDPDLTAGMPGAQVAPSLLDALLASAPDGKLDGGDRLAAALYRAGRFDDAAKLSASSDLPLAIWVRAKLALRAGDQKKAAAEYAKVIKAYSADEHWVPGSAYEAVGMLGAQCRVQGEAGTLALSQGDFAEAMTQFFNASADYKNDMSYVAERLMTTTDLQAFVDAHTKPQTLQKVPASEYSPLHYEIPYDEKTNSYAAGYEQHTLRAVLARRLMREGQYEKALAYFNSPLDQESAKNYGAALRDAEKASGIKKAEALFTAASLARSAGMEIMGTELKPDYAVWGGSYGDYEPTAEELAENPELAKTAPKPDALISAEEAKRVLANAPKPDQRFHYRRTAVSLAEQASALLPPRSQAYAATMCSATRWIVFDDPAEGERLYRHYLKLGAYVPWGGIFGTSATCPKPEFARAQTMLDAQTYAARKKLLKKALPFAIAGFGALILLGVALIWRRRKATAR